MFWGKNIGLFNIAHAVLKPGGRFAIMVEVVDADSKWTNFVEENKIPTAQYSN